MRLRDEDLSNLEKFEKVCWDLLSRASFDKNSGLRIFTFVTVNNSNYPYARNVVLRRTDKENKQLFFHTDYRSSKVNHIKENPNVTLCFWDKSSSLQIRVQASAILHNRNREAQSIISKLGDKEISLYKSVTAPGTKLSSFEKEVDLNEEDDLVTKNFCWVECKVNSIEVLHLAEYHTRAVFDYTNKEKYYLKA